MTPEMTREQLAAQPGSTQHAPPGESHLTGEQFGELLARPAEAVGPEPTLAEAHLLACGQCTAELASLREAITLFRDASSAYADEQLRGIPQWKLPNRRVFSHTFAPAYWFVAAAMFLTALLPLQVMRRHKLHPAAAVVSSAAVSEPDRDAQSDEMLLDEVNREISASVPTPMQALADPSADTSTVNNETSVTTSTQRKD